MRATRAILFGATAILVAGCEPTGSNANVAGTAQVAYTRFVNAVSDTGSLDFHFTDAVVLSPIALAVPYRSFSFYQATAPGARTFKAFYDSINTTGVYATRTIQIDSATATFVAGTYYTIILNGPSVGTKQSWIILTDNGAGFDTTWKSVVSSSQVGFRIVNLDTSAVSLFTYSDTTKAGTAFPSLATAVAPGAASPYVAIATSALTFDTLSTAGNQLSWAKFSTGTTFSAALSAPQGAAADALDNLTAIAGFLQGGGVISVYAWRPSAIGTSAFCAGTAPGVGPATCTKAQILTAQAHGISFVVDHHPSPNF